MAVLRLDSDWFGFFTLYTHTEKLTNQMSNEKNTKNTVSAFFVLGRIHLEKSKYPSNVERNGNISTITNAILVSAIPHSASGTNSLIFH